MNRIISEDLDNICSSNIDWMKFKNKTVLISGAYGMLPSYMVFTLIRLNETIPDMNIKIIAFVRNEKKLADRFGAYTNKPYFQTIIGDIKECQKIDEKIDYIIHGASPASSQYYWTNPVDVILPNMLGTYNLLELAKKNNVDSFLFFSSGEVYGSLIKDEVLESDMGAVVPMNVRSCYSESKRMGETLCKCYSHQYGLNIKVARPAHTYGPTMDIENDKRVFAEFVARAIKGEDIVMKSDGSAERTFCYIADAIIAFFTIMLHGENAEAYNVVNKNATVSIKELGEIVASLSYGKSSKVITEPRKNDDTYLENKHKKHSTMSVSKLEAFGWSCNYSIEKGFERTIKSFIKNGGGTHNFPSLAASTSDFNFCLAVGY